MSVMGSACALNAWNVLSPSGSSEAIGGANRSDNERRAAETSDACYILTLATVIIVLPPDVVSVTDV